MDLCFAFITHRPFRRLKTPKMVLCHSCFCWNYIFQPNKIQLNSSIVSALLAISIPIIQLPSYVYILTFRSRRNRKSLFSKILCSILSQMRIIQIIIENNKTTVYLQLYRKGFDFVLNFLWMIGIEKNIFFQKTRELEDGNQEILPYGFIFENPQTFRMKK